MVLFPPNIFASIEYLPSVVANIPVVILALDVNDEFVMPLYGGKGKCLDVIDLNLTLYGLFFDIIKIPICEQ